MCDTPEELQPREPLRSQSHIMMATGECSLYAIRADQVNCAI
jgi:hypothetical protein